MDKTYYIGQHEVVKADMPKEGWISYTIMFPNMEGVEEEVTSSVLVEQFEAMKSEEPYPDGEVAVREWKACLSELMGVILKYDIQMADRDFITNQLNSSITENYRKAAAKLFKRKHIDFVRMSQIDEVLKSDTEFLPE